MSWWIWLSIALILGVIEVLTTTFVLMWIAIAGAATAILTFFVPYLWVQVAVFAVVSAVLLIVTRPVVRRWRGGASTVPSVSERMVGKTAVVVSSPGAETLGTVRIQGEMWSAKSKEPIAVGSEVIVVRADSSVLEVEPRGTNVIGS